MPAWAFVPVILVAIAACPLNMWVMGKVMRRQVSCPMCQVGTGGQHRHDLDALEARKAAIEREIAQAKTEIEQNVKSDRTAAKAGEG